MFETARQWGWAFLASVSQPFAHRLNPIRAQHHLNTHLRPSSIVLSNSYLSFTQALARRYCARCRAIRLAQARISKFIDPTTLLPYWLHPGTGITSWSKPKVFGAEDVEHATMIATSRTEHLVRQAEAMVLCLPRPTPVRTRVM